MFNFVNSSITQILLGFYQVTGNLGIAIIAFTIVVRLILVPITWKSLKAQKVMRELQPELKKLKAKHGKDAKALQVAQMELYKKYNVNPLAGCLPQIVQLVLLIVLYQVLINFLGQESVNGIAIDPYFLGLDLRHPDTSYILPALTVITQLIFSLMILPGGEVRDIVPNTSKKAVVKKANEKEEDFAEMANSMQKQMMFIMPIMTGFLALRFPSGLALYWVATTVISAIQQYFVSGFGGLETYSQRALAWVKSKTNR